MANRLRRREKKEPQRAWRGKKKKLNQKSVELKCGGIKATGKLVRENKRSGNQPKRRQGRSTLLSEPPAGGQGGE